MTEPIAGCEAAETSPAPPGPQLFARPSRLAGLRCSRQPTASITATARTIKLASAYNSGVGPSRSIENTTIGMVEAPGPEVKLATTTSSSDKVNASSQPEASAGISSGSVTRAKHHQRRRVQVGGGILQNRGEAGQPGTHHHRHIGDRDGGVRERDGQFATARAASRSPDPSR